MCLASRLFTRALVRRRSSLPHARFSVCDRRISSKPNPEKSSDQGCICYYIVRNSREDYRVCRGLAGCDSWHSAEPCRLGKRLMVMTSKMVGGDEPIERLNADYRGAFDEWVVQVSRLKEVTSPEGSSLAKEAADRVVAAEN